MTVLVLPCSTKHLDSFLLYVRYFNLPTLTSGNNTQNHGEHMDVKAGAEACNPSLTDSTGNVNDLGKWYGEMCSGGAPVAVG